MKLQLHIDAPEEGDPQSTEQAQTVQYALSPEGVDGFAHVLEKELLAFYPDAARYDRVEISVSLTDAADMKEINRTYRHLDEPTDVLSFPLWESEGKFVPEGSLTEILPLGDIVICPEEMLREHDALPPAESFCLMLAHGFLHLLAWDHDTPEKDRAMQVRQNIIKDELLKALGEMR